MAVRTLTVIDNFYADPNAVRAEALALRYQRSESDLYTGRRALSTKDWSNEVNRLARLTGETLTGPLNDRQGSFVLALKSDESERLTRVHADRNRWAAIVYLSRPEDCQGGTGWYRHRGSGNCRESPEWMAETFGHLAGKSRSEIIEAILATSRDLSQWIEIQRVPMVFNRCVLFLAEEFHAVLSTFGDCPENGRLVQSFEFYALGDEGT